MSFSATLSRAAAPVALVVGDVVVIAPFVDAHLLAGQIHQRRRAVLNVLAVAELVDRDRRVMAVGHRPDDVLRAERRVAAEEHLRMVDCMVLGVDLRHAPASNSRPISRSIQGKAFSWPTATSTSSHCMIDVRLAGGTSLRRPLSSYSAATFSNVTPVELAVVVRNSLGTRKLRIGMPSCIASSFSQGDAFISSKPQRTTTLTSSPPRRRDVRQQSIAVLPPPSTITRLPMLVMWPNDTLRQPVDADMDVGGGFLAAGDVEVAAARRAGADEDRVVVLGQQRLQAVDALAQPQSRRRGR